ncbi:hypothetical protein [Winogradskyella jejuensis]|uniref:Adhesin domain-containing protein n=1 Tax=Winogradskyella jejuensis TaxID=1089305 RepID=A0A1M5M254_9FLAO|nr:hypothetical protein [Winogradskyella jejuensis]SHG71392.1 hypothetical protein SAMN05444148_0784 [Winogradskyella jejuensis]
MNKFNTIKSWNTHFKTFLFAGLLCISVFGFAQNKAVQSFSANGISEIIMNGDQIFNIYVITEVTETITLKSLSDGEYGNEFQVVSEVKGKQLIVSLKRTVLHETPDDKRNAHKVVAATLEIKMPDNLNLLIKSDIGSVNASGNFNELKINLTQGGCNINALARLATIKTIDGHIFVKTKDAVISTDSHHGLVDFPSDMLGFNLWKLSTVGGNITVKKQE